MIDRLRRIADLTGNMGWRYVRFRVGHEIRRRTGILRRQFPTNPPFQRFIGLDPWRALQLPFFFSSGREVKLQKSMRERLRYTAEGLRSDRLPFFNSTWYDLGPEFDWVTNPATGFRYDANRHWTQIPDFSPESGDIKFVWEPSRFAHIYDLIRYDYHFEEDCGGRVLSLIDSWIAANPINCGPNWRCSQEMSLRLMNWTFALFYYRHHPELTDDRFGRILHSIYWQLRHVRANIHFSRIAVRNNHAITECLMLYLGGLLFPFFPDAEEWKSNGKRWFEQEIEYQVYEDGSYLQFSMNYHRVVVQLLTWAIAIAKQADDRFADVVYERAWKSVDCLYQCQDEQTGRLPNYGNNDGALFFRLNDCHYRDYRPQINALHFVLTGRHLYDAGPWLEDVFWLGNIAVDRYPAGLKRRSIARFDIGGFYVMRDRDDMTFIRCGGYRDRPSQADNLHVDIWHDGANILRDAGTYKYNGQEPEIPFFFKTLAHNTVQIGDHDQMLKGPRFVWHYWTRDAEVDIRATDEYTEFSGSIEAFRQLAPGIRHQRVVRKYRDRPLWVVRDTIGHDTGLPVRQIWNLAREDADKASFSATDGSGEELTAVTTTSWYAELYGQREAALSVRFETDSNTIETTITLPGG